MDNNEADNEFLIVVKAFKTAAKDRGVKGAKLGQLVSFLASMPAEERHTFILPMADDPEALFEYVQIGYNKAQGRISVCVSIVQLVGHLLAQCAGLGADEMQLPACAGVASGSQDSASISSELWVDQLPKSLGRYRRTFGRDGKVAFCAQQDKIAGPITSGMGRCAVGEELRILSRSA